MLQSLQDHLTLTIKKFLHPLHASSIKITEFCSSFSEIKYLDLLVLHLNIYIYGKALEMFIHTMTQMNNKHYIGLDLQPKIIQKQSSLYSLSQILIGIKTSPLIHALSQYPYHYPLCCKHHYIQKAHNSSELNTPRIESFVLYILCVYHQNTNIGILDEFEQVTNIANNLIIQ